MGGQYGMDVQCQGMIWGELGGSNRTEENFASMDYAIYRFINCGYDFDAFDNIYYNDDYDDDDDVNIQGGRTWSQTCDSSHQWLEHGKWLAFDSKDKNL